jgi:hypothetical protein
LLQKLKSKLTISYSAKERKGDMANEEKIEGVYQNSPSMNPSSGNNS